MLDGTGSDPPTVPSNHPQNLERSSILITLSQLNSLVSNFSYLPLLNFSNNMNKLSILEFKFIDV